MSKKPESRDLRMVHPKVMHSFETLATSLEKAFVAGETDTIFLPFETYRSPLRQQYLYRETNETKSPAWRSAHQYGLAVDFVPANATRVGDFADRSQALLDAKNKPNWNWEEGHDYDFLKRSARKQNLDCPIPWDRCHVESKKWRKLADFLTSL